MRKILFAALVLGATPAWADDGEADAEKIGGMRIEVHAGIERPSLSDSQNGIQYVDKLGSSFTYGGEVGFDVAVSKKVTVGPYVSYDAGGSDKCESYSAGPGIAGTACFHSNANLSAGVRVALVSKKDEFFLGVGYSSYDVDFSITEVNTATSATTFAYANNGNRGGIDVSMGWNHSVGKHAYVGLGMKIGELGDFEGTGYGLQRAQGHVALGMRF